MSGWKSTACILCECNCGIEVQLGGATGVISVTGRPVAPALRETYPRALAHFARSCAHAAFAPDLGPDLEKLDARAD